MGRFVFLYVLCVLVIDAILLSIFAHWLYLFLAIPVLLIGFLTKKWWLIEREEQIVEGLSMGKGLSLANPDQPIEEEIYLPPTVFELGFLAIGSPGSGKSITVVSVLKYLSEKGCGWVSWDGKGDKDIYQSNVAAGNRPDKFFSSELTSSDTTNVVAGPVEAVIEALTQTFITSESEYYRNAQREALAAIVPLLRASGKKLNLRDIYASLKIDKAFLEALAIAKEASAPNHVVEVARLYMDRDPKDRANDCNGMLTKMSLFVTGSIADRLNAYAPSLDFWEAAKRNQKVYLHLPYSSLSRDISILFTEQIGVIAKERQLYTEKKDRQLWPQLYDDWGKFFYANAGAITARCRSARMPINYLFQSRGQTDTVEINRSFTTEITDNIGGLLIFRINGQETRDWAAKQFGTFEALDLSVSPDSAYRGQQLATVDAPRIRSECIRDLDAGEAYINCLAAGEGGTSSNKYFKARFPYPEMDDPESIDWPIITTLESSNDDGGLHLWDRHMDKNRVEELKKDIVEQAESLDGGEDNDFMLDDQEIYHL